MSRRLALLPALAALAFVLPAHAAGPAPQVTDPANDANGTANAVYDEAAPQGNQGYADGTSVLWQTTKTITKVKKGKKTKSVTTVTGFTVTLTLAAAPTPPSGASLVYRVLGKPACGPTTAFFGVVYYTSPDPNGLPQSALRDNCTGATRLTPIALPVISGNTMTWTVPLSVIPKDSKVGLGSKIEQIYFEDRLLENFPKGVCTPAQTPSVGATCGLATGVIDNSNPSKGGAYTIGG